MTFRINSVGRLKNGKWRCSIKGVEGRGIYGWVLTDPSGRGLELDCLEVDTKLLLPTDAFYIPDTADNEEATALFAKALENIGWGPEVDKAFNAVARSES